MMKLEIYASNEYVVWQNDLSSEMYFIVEGMLEVCVNVATTRALCSAGTSMGVSPSNATHLRWQRARAPCRMLAVCALSSCLHEPSLSSTDA
jgi:hypothetical protein